MAKLQLVAERKTDDGKVYDFRCPYPSGCGANGEPFSSVGWSDREHAVTRGKQHLAEHDGGEPMQTLDDFRTERGLTEKSAGQGVRPEDWVF